MTRAVWLRRELDRAETSNDGTLLPSFFRIPIADPSAGLDLGASFEKAFLVHYSAIRELLNARKEDGLGLVAAGPDGLEASAWFAAKPDEANPLILGRHSSAEVFLPSDPALSLRHLAVILHRQGVGSPVRFRILDLRTPTGFQDERGRTLEALASEGPLMVRCASFVIMMFPTGAASPPWSEDPQKAWARIPERLYTAARVAGDEGMPKDAPWIWHMGSEPDLADPGAATLVPSFPGPMFATRDLAASDPARGELLVGSRAGQAALRLGALAAAQGILLGRYERCDTAGIPAFSDAALSRVHLLVIELDGALYAVDTASTNGSWRGSESIRSVKLLPGAGLRLARDARVEWRPFH
jgi:hypothetical protein